MARLVIRRFGSGALTVVRSKANGTFRVALAFGTYAVEARPLGTSSFPRPPAPLTVRVLPHRFTRVTIAYDTGIR